MGCISSSQPSPSLNHPYHSQSKDKNLCIQKITDISQILKTQTQKQIININQPQFIGYYQTLQPTQNITLSTQQFTIKDKKMLDDVLKQNYLLHKLSQLQRKQIIQKFIIYDSIYDDKNPVNYENQNHQYVFKKGDIGTMFFVIKSGDIQIELEKTEENGKTKKLFYSKGDSFGQLALLYKSHRNASAKCLTKCTFLCLSSQSFKLALQNILQRTIETNKIFIERIRLFHYIGKRQKNKLANNVVLLKYEKNDVIFQKGDESHAFFIIISGKVQIQVDGKPNLQLGPGEYFGESSFKQNKKRSGTARCKQKAQLMTLSKAAIKKVFGKQYQEFYFFSILRWALKRNPILKLIPKKLIERLLRQSNIIFFLNNHIILKEDQKVQKIYIPIQGRINNFQVGDVVNSHLLQDIQQDKRTSIFSHIPLVKLDDGHVCVIEINKILSILHRQNIVIGDIKLKDLQELNKAATIKIQLNQTYSNSIYKSKTTELPKIQWQNLKIIDKLSDTQFGSIFKVLHLPDNLQYVLKTFDKLKVDSCNMQNFVKQQIQVMQLVKEHNFIVKYYCHYQLEQHVLILMELINCKDFFDAISEVKYLSKQKVQFYFAAFVLAVEYLHQNDIIYRDIKPQNAVLENNGYLKIIDMGTARKLSQKNSYRSFTMIGTPHYMAPQVIAGKGYSFEADIWSMGILLYELSCGYLPFGQKYEDPIQIYKSIIDYRQPITYPKRLKQNSIKNLIQRLLVKDPIIRNMQNFNLIKHSEFYERFQWEKFMRKEIKPPMIIDNIKSRQNDKTNFSQQTLMNFIDKQKFKAKRQNPNVNFPKWNLL